MRVRHSLLQGSDNNRHAKYDGGPARILAPWRSGQVGVVVSGLFNCAEEVFTNLSCGKGTISLFGCCRPDPHEQRDRNDKVKAAQNGQITCRLRDIRIARSLSDSPAGFCPQS